MSVKLEIYHISAEYTDFAAEMGMKERRDRVTVDGLGRV